MRRNQIILGLVFLTLFISLVALAFADESADVNRTGNAYGKNNMTYGKCVAAAAKIKNSCYSSSRTTYSSCKGNVAGEAAKLVKMNQEKTSQGKAEVDKTNQGNANKEEAKQKATAKKQASNKCKDTFKAGKGDCKGKFKAAKQECAKIKHNFIETVAASVY
jgi:hypothetical protein